MPVRRPADRNRLLREVVASTVNALPIFRRLRESAGPTRPLAATVPNFRMDPLESRQLLTTLSGGGMLNGIAQKNIFEFRDADNHLVRISLVGNVLAEFIFLRVDGTGIPDGPLNNNSTRFVDIVPFIPAAGGNPGNVGQGADLFSVYVTQADADSAITVSAAQTTGTRPDTPFASDGGDIRYSDAANGGEATGTIAGLTGSILLGARTKALPNVTAGPNAGDVLIPNRFNTAAIGVRPASAGRVFAGLEVVKGQKLGKFYFGGTVTGRVKVADSIGEFYAGNLFTGEANQVLVGNGSASNFLFTGSGTFSTAAAADPGNFYVGGDIDQLLVAGNIGALGVDTDNGTPQSTFGFKSGFSARIGGRLGSANVKGSIVGGFTVLNSNSVRTRGLAQREFEQRTTLGGGETYFEGASGASFIPSLSDSALFFNDSIDTAQYLGTFYNKELRSANAVQVTGNIGTNEGVDYFSVPLMAGQTISAQVASTLLDVDGNPLSTFKLGIFDPDRRLILSDTSSSGDFTGSKLQFTADRPGLYYFAVGLPGDNTFSGNAVTGGQIPYKLRVDNVGSLTVGTIAADGAIATFDASNALLPTLATESASFEIRGGDLGALLSTGTTGVDNNVGGGVLSGSTPYSVRSGSLRVIQGQSIGDANSSAILAPDLLVPFGNVGLLRSTGGILGLNPNFANPLAPGLFDDFDPARTIGGYYQLVDASGDLVANLGTKKGIGVIRAASVGTTFSLAPRWEVNSDDSGSDGTIDLIYVTGNLGTLGGGGPQITTGIGGNVRYMRVLGTVFRDIFFGGGSPDTINSILGRTVALTDDSGTQFDLIPPADPDGVSNTLGTAGTITATTYGIRDKGGSVLVDVAVAPASSAATNGFGTITSAGGLTIRSSAAGKNGSVEVGNIIVNGGGSTVAYDHNTRVFTPTIGNGDNLTFSGSTPIDVFQITAASTLGNVINNTTGEILNVTATSINTIEAQQLAMSKSRTGTEVGGAPVAAVFPFSTTLRNVIDVSGNIAVLRSRRGLGAVRAGTIGQVRPDSDGKHEAGYFEGIDAPIVSTGDIVDVNIGEGMLGGIGSNFSRSGLYAAQLIGTITNEGLGSDIRGDIVVQAANSGFGLDINGVSTGLALGGLDRINLRDGAIINAQIFVGFTGGNSVADDISPVGLVLSDFDTSPEAPTFDIGSINLSGKGGIIGSTIVTSDVGPVRISGGFGFITSNFITGPTSNNVGINTDGYGVRSSSISGGFLGVIQANGNGKLLSTADYTPSVRPSENSSIDPNTGASPNAASDLDLFLGVTKLRPRRSDSSEAGTIADSVFTGQRDINRIDAWRIRGHQPDPENPIPVSSSSFPMRIAFANSVGTIRAREKIDGLRVTGGSIKLLQTGNDMGAAYISVAGKITDIAVKGSVLSTSTINATGPDGRIDTLQTGKRLVGRVQTSLDIKNLLIGTDLFSRQVIVGRNLYKLSVAGDVKSGTNVRVGDRLANLYVTHDFEDGATIAARRIGTQFVGGSLDGDLVIG